MRKLAFAFVKTPAALGAAGLFAATALLDLRSLGNEFIWDDQFFIAENRFLQSFAYLKDLFTRSITEGAGGQPTNFYRPLQAFTHLLDVQLFGLNPWWHHCTNIFLHALMGALFYLVGVRAMAGEARGAGKGICAAAFGAMVLWMLHPLQAQAVGYLSGRGDILVGIFTALAALAFPRRPGLAALSCALAMLSKENGILAPAFVFLVDAASRPGLFREKKRWLAFWPLAVPAIAYVALRLTVLNLSNTLNFYNQSNVLTENYSYRVFTYLSVFAKSLALLFWPVDIHHERSWLVYPAFAEPLVLLGAAGLAAVLLVAWLARRSAPLATAGLLWFVLAGLPTSNLIALINALIYDHWFLIPSLGFAFSLAPLLLAFGRRLGWIPVGALVGLALIPLTMLSWELLATWATARTLYEQILRFEPRSSKIMNNLGMIYAQAGEFPNAEENYRRSLELNETPEGRNNLGNLYLLAGKLPDAERELRRAIEIQPRLFQAFTNLGRLRLLQRDCAGAAREFQAALAIYQDPSAVKGVEVSQQCLNGGGFPK